jgi:glycosyltransferase involved in cell wall biosynthesis
VKVLLLNDRLDPTGGSQLMTLGLRDGLRGRGHTVRTLASRAGIGDAGPTEADVTCFGSQGTLQTLSRTVNPSAAAALRRELRDFDPDVVHVRAFLTQLSPAILPLLRDRPAVMHAVMYDAVCPTGKKLLPSGSVCRERAGWVCKRQCLSWPAFGALMAQRGLYRRWRDAFDVVVANSQATAEKLEADGIGPVRVVHNAVPDLPQRGPLHDPPLAVVVARLSREKGVDVAVRAFAIARERVAEARLLVIGDGPERAALERLTAELGLGGAVRFAGRLSRAEAQARAVPAWVQLVPSVWDEPFGLVAAEAMMRGTAVIASGSGGLAEIVEDGLTGWLHRPGECGALAEPLTRVLRDRPLAQTVGAAARRRAMERFTMARVLDDFESIYTEVTAHE